MTKKQILVVEDDVAVSQALTVRLEAAGYDVSQAYDSTYGVSKAVNETPDLILLDLMMPAGGGIWVAERLNENPETSDVPVVFLTASREAGLRDRAHALGGAAYFEKPYDSTELLDTVDGLLSNSSVGGDGPRG